MLKRNVLAHLAAKVLIVNAFLCHDGWQIFKKNAALGRDIANYLIQRLIGNFQLHHCCALQLYLGKNDAFKHLFLQDVLRRQRPTFGLGLRHDQIEHVEVLALQHHAVIDDRGDAVTKFPRF